MKVREEIGLIEADACRFVVTKDSQRQFQRPTKTGRFTVAGKLSDEVQPSGTRWSSRVRPATLQLLMRHRSIDTTLKHYVAQDAEEVVVGRNYGDAPAGRSASPVSRSGQK